MGVECADVDTRTVLGRPYRPRVLDGFLADALTYAGAVVVEGPRACGKTMTAFHAAASHVFLDDEGSRQLAEVAPSSLLEGARPRLLDEWQMAPQLWNMVRRHVDRTASPGQFILTGSAVPADDATRHTGAGRFFRLRQRTLSWFERDPAAAQVSLAGLFAGERPGTAPPLMDYAGLVAELVRPGFPALVDLPPAGAVRLLRAYLDEMIRTDVDRLTEVRPEPVVLARLVRSLARSTAAETRLSVMAAALDAVAPGIKPETVARYVDIFERIFLIERQRAWRPELRTRARLRTQEKWHLADASLAAVALGVDAVGLRADPNTVGLLFESAVVHDLSVLSLPLDGSVMHYRDSNGHELDAVVVLPDGRWGAVEVKIAATQVAAGAASLAAAAAQVGGEPAFRLVVTGTGGTVVLDDGTITCPLSALCP